MPFVKGCEENRHIYETYIIVAKQIAERLRKETEEKERLEEIRKRMRNGPDTIGDIRSAAEES